MNWFGWGWTRSGWVRLCGPHPTIGECSHQLRKVWEERGIPDRRRVMTGGAPPSFTPRPAERGKRIQ